MLCDAAQVVDGKFFILGGGFQNLSDDFPPFALAGRIEFPPSEMGKSHKWEIYLEDENAKSVLPAEVSPISQTFELASAEGFDGDFAAVPFVINFARLELAVNARYTWRVYVDGRTDDQWFLSFGVKSRQAPVLRSIDGGANK